MTTTPPSSPERSYTPPDRFELDPGSLPRRPPNLSYTGLSISWGTGWDWGSTNVHEVLPVGGPLLVPVLAASVSSTTLLVLFRRRSREGWYLDGETESGMIAVLSFSFSLSDLRNDKGAMIRVKLCRKG